MARRLPKILVFDLDGCTWWPEMYHLWGGGGSPFTPQGLYGLIDLLRLGYTLFRNISLYEEKVGE